MIHNEENKTLGMDNNRGATASLLIDCEKCLIWNPCGPRHCNLMPGDQCQEV